ncbi:uncharacterized protein LOC142635095 [Castanea sativa]|uniref:uncharacterized protein LOC142635095 n=1 Tax=Castanea sativa TaxID=21020 RepID=UPI003F64CBE2
MGNKKSSFTVKSAYYVAKGLMDAAHDFVGITTQFLEKGSSTDLGLFCMAAWTIWGNRNNAIHNDAGCSPTQAWESAKQSQIDFTTSCPHDHPPHPTVRTHWSPPPLSFHKINIDGATTNDGDRSSIGVIIRDHTGATIGAFNKLLPSALPAIVTEAFALHQGVLFATEMGTSKAIFESDALALIQALNLNESGGELGHILQDNRSLAHVFNWSSFKHLKREGNRSGPCP